MTPEMLDKALKRLQRQICCLQEAIDNMPIPGCVEFITLQTLEGEVPTAYPLAVLDSSSAYIDEATSDEEYATIWNSDGGNQAIGTISATSTPFVFRMTYPTADCPTDTVLLASEPVEFPLLNFNDDVVPGGPFGLFSSTSTFLALANEAEGAASTWNSEPAYYSVAQAVPSGDPNSIILYPIVANPVFPEFRAQRYWNITAVSGTPTIYTSGGNTIIRKANGTMVLASAGTANVYTSFGMNTSTYGAPWGSALLVDNTSANFGNTLTAGVNYIFHDETGEWAWCDVFGAFSNNGGNLPPTVRHLAIQSFGASNIVRNLTLANFTNYLTALSNVEAVSFNGQPATYDGTWMNLMPSLRTWQMIDTSGTLRELASLNLSAAVTPDLRFVGFRRNNAGALLAQNDAWFAALPTMEVGIDMQGAQLEPAASVDGAFNNLAVSQATTVTVANARLHLQAQNVARTSASDAAVLILTGLGYAIS